MSAEDFFALKNPTASAGFEPANLGTKGQHATPRPPVPYAAFIQLCPPEDEHLMLETCRGEWYFIHKIIISASSW